MAITIHNIIDCPVVHTYKGFCYSCRAYRDLLHLASLAQYYCQVCGSFETRIIERVK